MKTNSSKRTEGYALAELIKDTILARRGEQSFAWVKRVASLGQAFGQALAAGAAGVFVVHLQKFVARNFSVGQLDQGNYMIDHFFLEKRGPDLRQGAGILAIIVPHDVFLAGKRARPFS